LQGLDSLEDHGVEGDGEDRHRQDEHAGEERPEREGDAEQLGRAVGDADRDGDDAQGEELREPVRATCQRNQGKRRRPRTNMSAMKTATRPRVSAR
jgi:hypothetical protein